MSDELPASLLAWVESSAQRGVTASRRIGNGTSRQIWAVDLEGGELLVVRYDTGDGPVAGTRLDLAREADVYRALAETSVAIPTLRALHPDGAALLVERVAGTEDLTSLTDAARQAVGRAFGVELGALHRLDPSTLDLGSAACPDGAEPTAVDLDVWREIDRSRSRASSTPVVGLALDLLDGTVPTGRRASVCHGDAGPGNFLHDGERVTALLDWEFAHVGDPHDDLAWVVVRNQMFGRPFDLSATFGAWSSATGRPVEFGLIEWFRALVLVRMLICCDAAIACAGPESPNAVAQAMLRPYLAPAVFEALRRAGFDTAGVTDLERSARAEWEVAPIAGLLDDPARLDDLGGTR